MKQWLSKYLSVLTLIPVFVLLCFIFLDVYRAYHALDQANLTIADVRLVSLTSSLVHEMQKERGMSAGYLSSKGAKFSSEIRTQRSATDKYVSRLKSFMGEHDYPKHTVDEINTLLSNLNKLPSIRKQVDSFEIEVPKTLSYYTGNNQIILDLTGHLAAELEETTSAERFLTLYNIAYTKEQAGIERAVLTAVFGRNSFTTESFIKFIDLTTKQEVYLKSTYSVAAKKLFKVLDEFTNSKESRTVQSFRDIATNKNDDFGVDPKEWFDAATSRINKLKKTEEALLNEVTEYAKDKVSSRTIIITVELIILILMIAVAYAVFTTIKLRARQSQEINRLMRKVDDEKDLTDTAQIITHDDIGKIAERLNVTISHIRHDFVSFQQNAHQIGEATLQAASATEQSKSNLSKLQIDISNIASATEKMNVSIQSDLDNIQLASGSAEKATEETVNGEDAVKVSMQGITQTAEEVHKVGNTITELNGRVKDILGMVDVIKSVAEQTNLLALNAAIEAARAGEQGRGFAVVADEVRSLAQRTQQSTQEISDVVDVLQNSSQNAFASIEKGNQQAKEAVTNASHISDVLTKIVTNIKSVDDVTKLISQSANEQSSVISGINSNASSINDQARENVVGAEQLSAASLQLSQVALDMEERIQAYKV